MFKNYFKTAWRAVTRHKLYSAINIAGLATGMAACIVILLLVFTKRASTVCITGTSTGSMKWRNSPAREPLRKKH